MMIWYRVSWYVYFCLNKNMFFFQNSVLIKGMDFSKNVNTMGRAFIEFIHIQGSIHFYNLSKTPPPPSPTSTGIVWYSLSLSPLSLPFSLSISLISLSPWLSVSFSLSLCLSTSLSLSLFFFLSHTHALSWIIINVYVLWMAYLLRCSIKMELHTSENWNSWECSKFLDTSLSLFVIWLCPNLKAAVWKALPVSTFTSLSYAENKMG